MSLLEHVVFLDAVEKYVRDNPGVAPHVSDYVSAGLSRALKDANERAADMEAALYLSLNGKKTASKPAILGKLKRWAGMSSVKWDDTINKMEQEA